MKKAFSLVELSIVLVIVGLLVGGILAGQSLVRASELRAVSTEYSRYLTATQAFRDKYFAYPGDMANATSLWGISTACSGASATGTCNGNADGLLASGGTGATSETFQFWNQLALAGMIEGQFTGVAGSSSGSHGITGVNLPASKLPNAAWAVTNLGTLTSVNFFFDGFYGNTFSIGSAHTGNLSYPNIFSPEEAWNIDTKLDDGMPATGRIVMRCLTGLSGCTSASVATDMAATYSLNSTNKHIALYFRRAF